MEAAEAPVFPVSDRLAVLEFGGSFQKICIFSVYMPDSTCSDDDVAEQYTMIEQEMGRASRRNRRCIIAGDLNAQIGRREEHDDPSIIGQHCYGSRTSRGVWLAQWCTLHGFTVMNSLFEALPDHKWTYKKAATQRELDYVLVNSKMKNSVKSCKVLPDVDIGSDHRPVAAVLGCRLSRDKEKKTTRWKGKPWPVDLEMYQASLNAMVQRSELLSADACPRLQFIEECLPEAAGSAYKDPDVEMTTPKSAIDEEIQKLILAKRIAATDLTLDEPTRSHLRKGLNKEIQKLTRRRLKERKTQRIDMVLKSFVGLNRIRR